MSPYQRVTLPRAILITPPSVYLRLPCYIHVSAFLVSTVTSVSST